MPDTIKDFVRTCVSDSWFKKYETMRAESSKSPEKLAFEEKFNLLAEELTYWDMQNFQTALSEEYGLHNLGCTKHFLVRLLSRFPDAYAPVMMGRVTSLVQSCRRRKKNKAQGHGLILIMNSEKKRLVTIMPECCPDVTDIRRGRICASRRQTKRIMRSKVDFYPVNSVSDVDNIPVIHDVALRNTPQVKAYIVVTDNGETKNCLASLIVKPEHPVVAEFMVFAANSYGAIRGAELFCHYDELPVCEELFRKCLKNYIGSLEKP